MSCPAPKTKAKAPTDGIATGPQAGQLLRVKRCTTSPDERDYVLLNLRQHQQMHISTFCVFFLSLSSYMFRNFRHQQGAYTKI